MIAVARPTAVVATVASVDLTVATALLVALLVLVGLFFCVRRDLWARLWFARCDPRPLGLFRVGFGVVVLWTLIDLLPFARFLFSDEGLWLTKHARMRYGGALAHLWDPQHGFEHAYDLLPALWRSFSLLHFRSDPPFVFAILILAILSAALMTLGVRTRVTTVVTWVLVDTLYRHNLVFYSGADTAMRVFLFLGMLSRWGEAYSLDAWRRYRRAVVAGEPPPPRRLIPSWTTHLMMLQLVIIYCTSGLLKTGASWRDGTALYYAASLEHFIRFPEQIIVVTWLQRLWILPIGARVTLLWELLFPLAILGSALRVYEDERARGVWVGDAQARPVRIASYVILSLALVCGAGLAYLIGYYYIQKVAWWHFNRPSTGALCSLTVLGLPPLAIAVYRWLRRAQPERTRRVLLGGVLGRRLWLGCGLLFHLGIEILLNVGIFVQVMIAPYLVWLSSDDLERVWRWLGTRPDPELSWRQRLSLVGLRRRAPRPPCQIYVGDAEHDLRRAALLRPWDLCGRLVFVRERSPTPGALSLRGPGDPARARAGARAGIVLARLFPAFWPLAPLTWVPLLRWLVGWFVQRVVYPPIAAAADEPMTAEP